MFGIFGLIVGLVVGFVFANSVNKTSGDNPQPQGMSNSNPAFPPDHPPLGTQSNGAIPTAPVPQVMESIERAKREPQNYEAQMTAADLYYQIQRWEDAALFYEAAVKLRPAENEPIIKLGNTYFDLERYTDAEKLYLKALEKEPNNLNVRTDLGLTFFLREPRDVDRAIREYNQALAVDPSYEITLQNLALAFKEKGDTAALKATADRLRKVNPQNPSLPRLDSQQ